MAEVAAELQAFVDQKLHHTPCTAITMGIVGVGIWRLLNICCSGAGAAQIDSGELGEGEVIDTIRTDDPAGIHTLLL